MSYYDVVFYILISLKVLLTVMMQNKIVRCVAAIRIFVSVLYMKKDSDMNNMNSAFCMQFAYKLFSPPVALLSAV